MKIHTTKRVLIVTLLSVGASTTVYADDWQCSARGMIGNKHIKESDWGYGHKKHLSVGLLMDFKPSDSNIAVVLDMLGSNQDEGNEPGYDAYTAEFHLGARANANFLNNRLQPYLDGGIARAYVEEERMAGGNKQKDDDSATGAWAGVGVNVKVTQSFSLGVDARYSYAKANVFGKKRQIGGVNIGASLGYHF